MLFAHCSLSVCMDEDIHMLSTKLRRHVRHVSDTDTNADLTVAASDYCRRTANDV